MTAPNVSDVYLPGTIQIPSSLVITAATNANPMVITVAVNDLSESNTYHVNQVVRLTVPITYGMFQANGLLAKIIAVNGNVITLDVDSTAFDVFIVPSGNVMQPASVAPAGSRNLSYDNTTNQVPFQSLNNIGN